MTVSLQEEGWNDCLARNYIEGSVGSLQEYLIGSLAEFLVGAS